MVVNVKLEGLNIIKARGRWYVYVRDTKERLIGGFEGSRQDLMKRLARPDIIEAYNRRRVRDLKQTYQEGTIGALVEWFENECPKYQTLAEATKAQYSKGYAHLREEFDFQVNDITQADLYDIRDRAAMKKNPRFADIMIAALSSMFSQAVKRGKMKSNPALGMDKCHKANPNANREWRPDEWEYVAYHAPRHLLTPMMIARHAGYRGQTIVKLRWNDYQADPRVGRCFRVITRKNDEQVWIPATYELQAYLDALPRPSVQICTQETGQPWKSEVQMQTAVSHYLRALEDAGKIGDGTTLHGLRTSYAAGLRRSGAETGDVAAALGDKSERMGAHYTRHVENEARVIRAFEGKKQG